MRKNQFLGLAWLSTKRALLVMLFATGLTVSAQVNVSGWVKDVSEQGIPGVTIVERGTMNGTLSNLDGQFSITVAGEESVLEFSSVGMKQYSVQVNDQSSINVIMNEDVAALEEVVVIGYGTMARKDLTGSSVSVNADKIADIPATSAAEALIGKAAGVNIVTQSGAPGSDINILIRGGTSITQSTEPLYIVDGFQMEKGLQNIDVNDIESIDIMKDASATAIYGARGSNGVVLITTKTGKKGKTEVFYNTYYSFEKLANDLDVLEAADYVRYQYEFQSLAGNQDKWASIFGGNTADADFYTGANQRISSEYGSRKAIDWQQEIFGNSGLTRNHNARVMGGNETSRFMLSYNFTGQDGVMSKSGYQRNGVRLKLNHEISPRIRMDFNTDVQSTEVKGGGSLGGLLKMTILQPPTGGIRYTNEELLNSDVSNEMLGIDSQYDIFNPRILNEAVDNNRFTRRVSVNAGLDFDIWKDLMFRTSGSYQWQQRRSDFWDDGRTKTAQNFGGPYGSRDNSEYFTWQIINTLTWTKEVGRHDFNLLVGQETYFRESIYLDNEYHNFPENNFELNDVRMGTAYAYGSGKANEGMVSGFGRVVYNYDNRYLFTGTLRGDGSSKFKRGNQWGYFPSMAGAWRISEEDFLSSADFLDNLKLRIGYGQSGNNSVDNNMYATDYQGGQYAISNSEVSTLVPGNVVGNPTLKWETISSTNFGVDVALWGGRFSFMADYYNNESDDLLIKNRIPSSTGYSFQFQNIGAIRNQGFEFVINTSNIRTKDFSWNTDFNVSFNRSKVLSLYGDEEADFFIQNYGSRIDFMVEVGSPLGQMYGYNYDGVYTTDDFLQNSDGSYVLKAGVPSLKGKTRSSLKPGDVKYKTHSGQTDEEGNPIWSTDDRTIIGNAEPKFSGGMANSFKYKAFDLNVFLSFVYGNDVFNMNSQRFIGPYLPNQNTLSVMNDRFTLIDPETGKETMDLNRLAALNPGQFQSDAMWSLHSDNKIAITDALDYYVEDGSFLRVSNITLGYSVPKSVLSRYSISKLRLYGTLNNPLLFTKYSGYDPEVSATSSLLTRGIDDSSYPRSKSIVFGLNLVF